MVIDLNNMKGNKRVLPKVIAVYFLKNALISGGCGFEGCSFAESWVWLLSGPVRSLDPVRLLAGGLSAADTSMFIAI